MKSFDCYDAKTINEAIALLQRFDGKACLLSGGTDLIAKAKKNLIYHKILIDISKIKEMRYIKLEEKNIYIGAATKLYEIAYSETINNYAKILANAANKVGSIQIRNMATIGGNVGNAAPSGDTITPLMVLDAKAVIVGPKGEHFILVSDLFKGPGITILSSMEMIKEFIIPCIHANTGTEYLKDTRRRGIDIATVGCAVRIEVNPNNKKIIDAAIALGSVAPIPVLLRGIGEKLKGKIPDIETCQEMGNYALSQVSPITDVRATKEYRSHIVKILVRDGIMAAYEGAF